MQVHCGTNLSGVLIDPLIGSPFGSNFRIDVRGLVQDPRTVEEMSILHLCVFADDGAERCGVSNAKLNDTSIAQRLGQSQLCRLKESGASGEEVVRSLAKNSQTFSGKTIFAQKKYLRKKTKKHMPIVSLHRLVRFRD